MRLPLDRALSLRPHFEHPSRVDAHAFANEALAFCWLGDRNDRSHTAAEVGALPKRRRNKMLRDVVAVNGLSREWRALYGSHLSMDERFFTVAYSKWGAADLLVKRMGERHRELQEVGAFEGKLGKAISGASILAEFGPSLTALAARKPVLPELVSRPRLPARSPAEQVFHRHNALAETMRSLAVVNTVTPGAVASITNSVKLADSLLPGTTANLVGSLKIAESVNVAESFKAAVAPSGALRAITDSMRVQPIVEALAKYRGLTATRLGFGIDPEVSQNAVKVAGLLDGQAMPGLISGSPGLIEMALETSRFAESFHSRYSYLGEASAIGRLQVAASQLLRATLPKMPEPFSIKSLIAQPPGVLGLLTKFPISEDFLRRLDEACEKADRFANRWKAHRLSYLASGIVIVCRVDDIVLLEALEQEQAVEAFLHLLEAVAVDGECVGGLREEVRRAPFMTQPQRVLLDAFLGHVEDREWIQASSDMYSSLEGAFWEVAIQKSVVTRDRCDPLRPSKTWGFETMIKRLLASEAEFATWMAQAVFGTEGNPFRHGSAEDGHRRQALFGLVALAGWFQSFTGVQAWDDLIERGQAHIVVAVERAQDGVLIPA